MLQKLCFILKIAKIHLFGVLNPLHFLIFLLFLDQKRGFDRNITLIRI